MKKSFSILCLTLCLSISGLAQETDLRDVFLTAESYFLFEEFNEALPLYLQIHRHYPDNDNINFKIGVCFVNSPYEKDKSIVYLEKAAKNINPKYRENNFRETSAPPEALYYLGNAYRVNNQLIKAKEYYSKFLNVLDPDVYDTTLVKNQIAACNAAASLMKKPIDVDRQDLSNRINTRFAETNAVVSGDETKMAFISKLQFYDAIFYTEKENGKWKVPRNIVPELGVDGDVYPTFLSYDGTEMFIYRNDEFVGNLYYTRLLNGRWTSLVKLNDKINTKYWESHASMTRDRQTLYFSSNRKGGYGGLDIYKSQRQPNGDWGPATNLGPNVNSPYNDDTPFITEDAQKLYFCSYGHYNMGGYDIFVSKKMDDGTWAKPANLGYPVNTTDDDQFYFPVKDGQAAYYSRYTRQGHGKFDIYRYEVYSPDNPRMFPITGLLNYMGEDVDSSEVTISVVKDMSSDTIAMVNPYSDGTFRFSVPAGEYNMIFDSDRFEKHMQKLSVAATSPHEGFTLPGEIALQLHTEPLTPEALDNLLTLRDTLITVDNEETVRIRFKTDKDNRAIITIYNDSVLVKTDTIVVNRKRQSYEFTPAPGHNKVVITVEDENGNVVQKSAEVFFPQKESTGPAGPVTGEVTGQMSGTTTEGGQTIESATKAGNLNIVQNKLQSYAAGNLAAVLDTLDTEKAGITSLDRMMEYLNDHAGTSGYTTADVEALLRKAATIKDLSEFIHDMHRVSKGRLKQTLEIIDPEASAIQSPRELIDHLITISSDRGYTADDVLQSLGILASAGSDDPFFLLKVIKSRSSEDLGGYLDYLKLEEEDIHTAGQLAVHLYKHADSEDYTKNELLDLLTELALAKDALNLKEKLAALAEGDLKPLLDTLDLLSNGIYSAEDLVDFLYSNKYNLNVTPPMVDDLLKKYIEDEAANIEDLRRKMESLSQGKLRDFLSSYDVNKGDFSTEDAFIAFLKDKADSLGFSAGDVNKALLKLAYDGDLDDIIRKLSEYATPVLKDRLLSLDTDKENITSVDDLIRNIFDNTGGFDYSRDDVIRMLSDYTTMSDLQLFIRKLAELSEGNTRDFILSVDTEKQDIHTKQDLVDYLLGEADAGNLDKTEIIHLILQAEQIPAGTVAHALTYMGNENINGLIDNLPGDIRWADEVFNYLLEQSKTSEKISNEEILDLFSKYLQNYDLHLFHKKMAENASGDLLSFLKTNNPQKAGIANVADYIRFLLDQADQNPYSGEDVYHLLAKVISQDNLRQFIEQMKEFAGSDLRKALIELDLNKLNITNTSDLIEYLIGQAGQYGFDPSEIWDILLKMALHQTATPEAGKINLSDEFARSQFKRGIKLTA
ncbi:MAG TPA: hypothetical protein VE870_02705, partial [Bacteroidales bacterium]|nr:hypothetical protein [Bacteroidales bacterium]